MNIDFNVPTLNKNTLCIEINNMVMGVLYKNPIGV